MQAHTPAAPSRSAMVQATFSTRVIAPCGELQLDGGVGQQGSAGAIRDGEAFDGAQRGIGINGAARGAAGFAETLVLQIPCPQDARNDLFCAFDGENGGP